METKKCSKCKKELPISHFYQKKDGEYDYLCKQHRKANIIDDQPYTVLESCKYFDIPFIEYEWFHLVNVTMHRCVSHKMQYDTIFGKYLSKMKLKDFQNYTYKDSSYINSIIKEKGIANTEGYREEFLPKDIKEYFDITSGRENNED